MTDENVSFVMHERIESREDNGCMFDCFTTYRSVLGVNFLYTLCVVLLYYGCLLCKSYILSEFSVPCSFCFLLPSALSFCSAQFYYTLKDFPFPCSLFVFFASSVMYYFLSLLFLCFQSSSFFADRFRRTRLRSSIFVSLSLCNKLPPYCNFRSCCTFWRN